MKPASSAQSVLNSKSEIVNSKSTSLPIASQITHLANTTRSVPNSKSEIVNRTLDKPAYKAAISPGPPILPSHYKSRATSHESRITSRLTPRNLTAPKVKMYEGLRTNLSANYAKRTQSPKCPKSPQPQSPQRITQIKALQQHPKTNPIFRSSGAPKGKTNPNEPNLSRRSLLATAKFHTKLGGEAGTNPHKSASSGQPVDCWYKC